LNEEKQSLVAQLNQLKSQGDESGRMRANNMDLQQKVREQELKLSQAQVEARQQLDKALIEARMNAQNDARVIEELKLKNQRLEMNQASNQGQAQATAQDIMMLNQEIARLSQINEQLQAQKKAESPARAMPADSTNLIIDKLSEENTALKTELAQTWAKINEQTKKIEEERSAFWEELEAVRRKDVSSPTMPAGITLLTTSVPTTNPAQPSSPLLTSIGRQAGANPNRPQAAGAPGAPGAPRQVPTMAAPSRTAAGMAQPSRVGGAPRPGPAAPQRNTSQAGSRPGLVMESLAPSVPNTAGFQSRNMEATIPTRGGMGLQSRRAY
jgi:hypothetical protein